MHRKIEPLIGPHRGNGDHLAVGLAVPAQPLPGHVGRLGPVLADPLSSITSTPPPCGAVAVFRQQQLQPTDVHRVRISPGLRQEELQPLNHSMLRSGHRIHQNHRPDPLRALTLLGDHYWQAFRPFAGNLLSNRSGSFTGGESDHSR